MNTLDALITIRRSKTLLEDLMYISNLCGFNDNKHHKL